MGKRPLVWDQESGSNPVVSVKVAPLLTGVWSCGVKSQFTEVVRVHLGIWDLCWNFDWLYWLMEYDIGTVTGPEPGIRCDANPVASRRRRPWLAGAWLYGGRSQVPGWFKSPEIVYVMWLCDCDLWLIVWFWVCLRILMWLWLLWGCNCFVNYYADNHKLVDSYIYI